MSELYRSEIHLPVGALTGPGPIASPFPEGLPFDPQCPALLSAIVHQLCKRGYEIKPVPGLEPLQYSALGRIDQASFAVWVSALDIETPTPRYVIGASLPDRRTPRRTLIRFFSTPKDKPPNLGQELTIALDQVLESIVAAAGGQTLHRQIVAHSRPQHPLSIRDGCW